MIRRTLGLFATTGLLACSTVIQDPGRDFGATGGGEGGAASGGASSTAASGGGSDADSSVVIEVDRDLGGVEILDVRVDSDGVFYVGGVFWGEVALGGATLTGAPPARRDALVARVDLGGGPSWSVAMGAGDTGMDRVEHLEPDPGGGVYFTGVISREEGAGGDRYARVVGALDRDGALRWTREIEGPGIATLDPNGWPRVLVAEAEGVVLLDLHPRDGALVSVIPYASGWIVAATENAGRFGMVVSFDQVLSVGELEPIERPGSAMAAVTIDANRAARVHGVFDTEALAVYSASLSLGPADELAMSFAFSGELDFGDGSFAGPSPFEVPYQGPSLAVTVIDGRAVTSEAVITDGSIRQLGVAALTGGRSRALFGVSFAEVTIGETSVGGAPDESRAFIDLGPSGGVSADATQADALWPQDDGGVVTRTVVRTETHDTITLTRDPSP